MGQSDPQGGSSQGGVSSTPLELGKAGSKQDFKWARCFQNKKIHGRKSEMEACP